VFRSPDGLPIRATLFRRRFWPLQYRQPTLRPFGSTTCGTRRVALDSRGAHRKQVAVLAGHTSVSVVLDRCGHLYVARARSERQLIDAVATARAAGLSWQKVGAMLGVSAQAAQPRYGAVAEAS